METFDGVIQEALGGGAYVEVPAERTIEVPADLAESLEAAGVREAFDALSFSHRREHVQAIEDAKKPETRARRIAKAVEMVKKKS